ncbi:MAG: 50S ribosomal protein L18 [Pseudomonadota bacterium]
MKKLDRSIRRGQRARYQVRKRAGNRPRLSVFKSNKHIFAQVIDDAKGSTVASASTIDKDLRAKIKNGSNAAAAQAVGKLVAGRAIKQGVKDVVFDRGGALYHGRVRALADAAREAGLAF